MNEDMKIKQILAQLGAPDVSKSGYGEAPVGVNEKEKVAVGVQIQSESGIIRGVWIVASYPRLEGANQCHRETLLEGFLMNKPLTKNSFEMGADAFANLVVDAGGQKMALKGAKYAFLMAIERFLFQIGR